MRGGMAELIVRIEQEAFEIARGVGEGGGDVMTKTFRQLQPDG